MILMPVNATVSTHTSHISQYSYDISGMHDGGLSTEYRAHRVACTDLYGERKTPPK